MGLACFDNHSASSPPGRIKMIIQARFYRSEKIFYKNLKNLRVLGQKKDAVHTWKYENKIKT